MSEVKKIATRESYGNALAELGAQYKDLVVRVAGYSTYFTILTPGTQEDIIRRSEQTL